MESEGRRFRNIYAVVQQRLFASSQESLLKPMSTTLRIESRSGRCSYVRSDIDRATNAVRKSGVPNWSRWGRSRSGDVHLRKSGSECRDFIPLLTQSDFNVSEGPIDSVQRRRSFLLFSIKSWERHEGTYLMDGFPVDDSFNFFLDS